MADLTKINPNESLMLNPFPNGGWTISQRSGTGQMPTEIGAYSDADSMLDALRSILREAAARTKGSE